VNGKEYSQKSRQAFLEALNDASPGFTDKMARDSALVFKTLPWLSEWHDKLVAQAVVDIREAGKLKHRLRRDIQPVLNMVSSCRLWCYMRGED
jgi:hypothetical protein